MHIPSYLSSAVIFLTAPLAFALTYRGADFSSLDLLVADGQLYYDNSSSAVGFETILAKRGVNLARIRIWTSTNNDDYSLDYGLALAAKAYDAGMEILVDLHYSDTCE
jgi:arabinogalactan endo-1,4-beta-galactosidase